MSVDAAPPNAPTLADARKAIADQGLEFFRIEGELIHLATRVRSHLMDASVSLRFGVQPCVSFTVRAQSSDFPGASGADMFEKVRSAISANALARGFSEIEEHSRQVQDPVDHARILDVWYELTFSKEFHDLDNMLDDVRWSLSVSKCVGY
jgi:hypothetical protein